ncbi:MAG: ATP-dependent DNA helicase RecQ [Spirochaetaceae bacterium]|nr:MAG: ATP-dependent DNA helicase RecQ [Spirochaetaceae bacterium]
MPELELPDPIGDAARTEFGVRYLFPYQRLVISNVLDAASGDDTAPARQIVILPTGAGKSLCFQLPARMVTGITVIVYPLLALISDQERRISSSGPAPVVLRGGQSADERRAAFGRLERHETNTVLANPEVLAGDAVSSTLRDIGILHVVLDEAHCVAEWGLTFRPAYLRIREFIDAVHPKVVTAFTATASPALLAAVREIVFGDEPVHIVQGNPDRPNIAYAAVPSLAKDRTLAALLRGAEYRRPAVVFCSSRLAAEMTARALRDRLATREVKFYHAGLSREEKTLVEGWFFESTDGVLVGTTAYGLGVDKSNIRSVLHRDVPPSVESYLQESGRAGRDTEPARAVLVYGSEDFARRRLVRDERSSARFEAMLGYALTDGCRREYLVGALGIECTACFGCDSCRGDVVRVPDAARELTTIVARRPRRYASAELAAAWCSSNRLPAGTCPPADDWTVEDKEAAVEGLVEGGSIKRISRGPWRRRLVSARSGIGRKRGGVPELSRFPG